MPEPVWFCFRKAIRYDKIDKERSVPLLLILGGGNVQAQNKTEALQKTAADSIDQTQFAKAVDLLKGKDLPKAIPYYKAYIERNTNLQNDDNTGRGWEVMGMLHWQAGDLNKGIECHRLARVYYIKSGNHGRTARSLNNIGIYWYYNGQRDSAMMYYLQSVEESQNANHHHELALAYYNMGNLFSEQKNYTKSFFIGPVLSRLPG